MDMHDLGRLLLIIGLVTAAVGGVLLLVEAFPAVRALWAKFPLGRLPGDIVIEKPGMKLYIPITSAVLVSVVLSVLAHLFRR